jgi:hypothetical protein
MLKVSHLKVIFNYPSKKFSCPTAPVLVLYNHMAKLKLNRLYFVKEKSIVIDILKFNGNF